MYNGGQYNNLGGGSQVGYPAPGMVAPQYSTPPRSSMQPVFTTLESSPDNFDFENASPRHQQMFVAVSCYPSMTYCEPELTFEQHLAEYNSPGALRRMGINEQMMATANNTGMVHNSLDDNALQMVMGVGHQSGQQMPTGVINIDPSLADKVSSNHSGGAVVPDHFMAPGNASMTNSRVVSNDPFANDAMVDNNIANSAMLRDNRSTNSMSIDAMLNNPRSSSNGVVNTHMPNSFMSNNNMSHNAISNSIISNNSTRPGNAQLSDGVFIHMRMNDGALVDATNQQRPANMSSMPETSADKSRANDRE